MVKRRKSATHSSHLLQLAAHSGTIDDCRQAAMKHHLLLKWRHSADNAWKMTETLDTVANPAAPQTHICTCTSAECWQTHLNSTHNSFSFTLTKWHTEKAKLIFLALIALAIRAHKECAAKDCRRQELNADDSFSIHPCILIRRMLKNLFSRSTDWVGWCLVNFIFPLPFYLLLSFDCLLISLFKSWLPLSLD